MNPTEEIHIDKERYGHKVALTVSIVLHVGIFVAVFFAGTIQKKNHKPPMSAITVKLGGPPSLKISGAKRKAPVAGVKQNKKQPPPKAKPKKTTTKKAAPKKNEVGLNRDKKKKKKPTPSSGEKKSRKKEEPKAAPPPTPPPEQPTKGAKAIGGLDGKDGTGVSLEVGDGNEVLDTDDVEFISYFRQIHTEVASRWVKAGFTKGMTRVRFHISPDGSVDQVEVTKSSGYSYLDGPAKRAVIGAEFPPLPQGYRGQKLIVNMNFQYGSEK